MTIELDPDTHVYRVDGRVVPSVTQVLKAAGLIADYTGVDPAVLEHAKQRGMHVEQCCALWTAGELDETSVHAEAMPYLAAFKEAVKCERMSNFRWQVLGYHQQDNVAGMTDILCDVRDRPGVVDVKATAKLDRSYRIQLTAYRRQHDPANTWSEQSRWILHLKKTGTYDLVDCAEWERHEGADDDALWLAAVSLAKWKALGGNGKGRAMTSSRDSR